MPSTEASQAEIAVRSDTLHIAVAVIQSPDQKILLSQRREGTDGAGLWEYPGGKCEPGEAVEQSLARELQEELGITPRRARPLIRIRHQYPDRHVLLDTWLVDDWSGVPKGLEGQALAWVDKGSLLQWDLLPANGPITEAINLPDLYAFTPDVESSTDTFVAQLERTLQSGIKLIRLRAANLDDSCYESLAIKCLTLCREYGASLLLDRGPEMVLELGANGLHLTGKALLSLGQRPAGFKWLVASCHSASELDHAAFLGCDFVVLGSVKATASHPGGQVLGWETAQALLDQINMPAYVIGGLGRVDLAQAYQAGAQGIAGIRALWNGGGVG